MRKIVLISLLVFLTGCSSVSTGDVATMLVTFSSNFPRLKALVFAFSYLAGIWFVMSAIHKFKMLSSPQGGYSMQVSAMGVIIQLIVGAALLALPSFIKMSLYSLWGTGNIMSRTDFSGGTLSYSVEKAIVGLIQLFGYISVVRGLMILNKIARQQAAQDTFGKAIMHIIGGILSINIMKTIEVVKKSFGI